MNSGNGQNGSTRNVRSSRTLSASHLNQIHVLRTMSENNVAIEQSPQSQIPLFEISEIAEKSGLSDEREVQRYLLILEGQKLVSPFPEGDFTSSRWYITTEGIRAIRTITGSVVLQ